MLLPFPTIGEGVTMFQFLFVGKLLGQIIAIA